MHSLSAQTVQDDRKVNSFENIKIFASDNTYVHISYDRSHKITVKADGRLVSKVRTTVAGDTLTVHLLDLEEVGNAKIEIYIRSPKVKKVIMAGSGQVEIIDGFNPNQFQALTGNVHPLSS
jgi:hypothetical protein